MKFVFISEPTFETWDWRNPDIQGIGGSETSHIEMAGRLAARGHQVRSFASIPDGLTGRNPSVPLGKQWVQGPSNVWWSHTRNFDPHVHEADAYVIYRAPHFVDQLPPDANAWLICQDVDYLFKDKELTKERAMKFSRIVALCKRHADFLKSRYPWAADRIVQSSNGIKTELIEQIEQSMRGERLHDPLRLMYASSPDRGLEYLLDIFPRAKEIIPELELHVYYGFNNIEKIVERLGPNHWIARNTLRLKEMMNQDGVFDHGRMGQPELLREWFKAGIWCHPSNFTETSCITCMDAQACGAIPITSPLWAVAENVEHGVFIDGDVRSDLVISRFVLELVKLASDTDRQAAIRQGMMSGARQRFTWENCVTQWEQWAAQDMARSEAA